MSVATIFRLEVTPSQVAKNLPPGLIPGYSKGQGFAEKLIVLPTSLAEFITFRISFDGESELLAVLETNLYKYSEEEIARILHNQFLSATAEEDDDEESTDDDNADIEDDEEKDEDEDEDDE